MKRLVVVVVVGIELFASCRSSFFVVRVTKN